MSSGRAGEISGDGSSAAPGRTQQVSDKHVGGACLGGRNADEEDVEDEGVVADDHDGMADGVSHVAVDDERVLVVDGDGLAVAPDGGWGWMIVFVSFLCAGVVDGLCSVFGVILPDLVVYFQQSSSTVAVAGSLLAGGFLLYGTSYDSLHIFYGHRVNVIFFTKATQTLINHFTADPVEALHFAILV